VLDNIQLGAHVQHEKVALLGTHWLFSVCGSPREMARAVREMNAIIIDFLEIGTIKGSSR